MRAIGVGADLTGAARVIHLAASCIRATADVWPTDNLKNWELVTETMLQELAAARAQATDSTLHLFSTPDGLPEQQRQFLAYAAPALKAGPGYEAHALIGKALVIAATTGQLLPVDFLSGIQTIGRARQGKGRRSADWDPLLKVDLTDSASVLKIAEFLPEKSPAFAFAKFSAAILGTVALAPVFRQDALPAAELASAEDSAREEEERIVRSIEAGTPGTLVNADDSETLPDISGRFASADYTSFSEKLGLTHRDYLLVADLAFVTSKFPPFIDEATPEIRGFTVLATISLVTGWSDKSALKLRFCPGHNNWLDLDKGAWAWDFETYKKSRGGSPDFESSQPIFCPWPAFLDQALKRALQTAPESKTLEELVLAIQGIDQFDLKKYRKFLRSCGHPAHPPYAARFARSLSGVYLELTGSDMTAALMTGFSAAVAPAALFYYGPHYETLIARVTTVYDRLGLGPPSAFFNPTGRAGCQKLLEEQDLQTGWKKLTDEINRVRQLSAESETDEQRRLHCNRWMALTGAGFVIQSAHRSSRMECLTAGALYVHSDVVLIPDKDEDRRAQPRLVPKNVAIRQLLLSAAECRNKMENAGKPNGASSSTLDHSAPVFLQWTAETEGCSEACLSTAAVAEIAQEFFGSAANFGRSQWVTYSDQYGCDRWLIRSLTGHTRDVTRTHGPYFDMPPLTMAAKLRVEMEKVGLEIFGNTTIDVTDARLPKIAAPVFKPSLVKSVTDGPVPDPRILLAPLTETTLTGWNAVEQIRKDLFAGRIDAPPHALVVLHLSFIDQIPLGQTCLDAVTDTSGSVKTYGQRKGVQWHRPHFSEPTWLPIQTTTSMLLDRLPLPPPPAQEIIRQVCCAVRNSGYGVWPTSNAICFDTITNLSVNFRRLSFPPSLAAVSDLAVPAPCLSALSLHRLCGEEVLPLPPQMARRTVSLQTAAKSDGWRFLVSTLNKYSSKVQRHGERQARAVGCLADLRDSTVLWTPFSAWLRNWAIDELKRTRDGLDGCYQISSVSTYLSTLGCAQDVADIGDDPQDWEDGEWSRWAEELNHRTASAGTTRESSEIKEELNERAKHALHALVTSLIRRNQFVPLAIRSQLGFQPKKPVCRNSASSTLILKADLERSIGVLKEWHDDSPVDFLMVEFRATLSAIFPCRAGDISSLKSICLTPAGGLVFERSGYDVHKTKSAIRLIFLTPEHARKLEQKIQKLYEHSGERPLLLRGDGSHAAGLRDQRLANDFGLALKIATGDPRARPHSVRAATLQDAAWPGWEEQARDFINGKLSPAQCSEWVSKTAEFLLRLSRAVANAGQSDLRSALGNYLAAWPLIYAIHCTSSLLELLPDPAFLTQLGLSSTNLRKARSRHPAQSGDLLTTGSAFDTKAWVELQAVKINTPRSPTMDTTKATIKSTQKPLSSVVSSTAPKAATIDQLAYLAVRALGLSQARALEKVVIPRSLAVLLDLHLPSEDSIACAVSRARQGPESRGQAADIAMALSPAGKVAAAWLYDLNQEDFRAFKSTAFKAEPSSQIMVQKVVFFEKLADSLPETLAIGCRFGTKHLDTSERCALALLAPAITVSTDPRLGKRPVLTMAIRGKQNLVVSARLTSAVRVYTLIVEALRKYHKGAGYAA